MIEETMLPNGKTRGRVRCGSPMCDKILYSYEGNENSPGPDRDTYLLAAIETRYLFVDKLGQPAPFLSFDGMDDLLNFMAQVEGRGAGYRAKPGSRLLMEDFCSDSCASSFLENRPDWGICFYRKGNSLRFVAQATDRFKTETLGFAEVRRPGDVLRLKGKDFKIYEPPISNGDPTPRFCIPMESLVVKCALDTPLGACNTWIRLIADFAPSAWVCPSCGGLYMLDYQTEMQKYAKPTPSLIATCPSNDQTNTLMLFLYSSERLSWGNSEFANWLEKRIGRDGRVTEAIQMDKESINMLCLNEPRYRGKILRIPFGMNAIEAERLFGC